MRLNKNKVKNYYKYADIAYRILWRDKDSLGMHLGFWYKNTKSHKESLLNHNLFMAKISKINSKDIILDAGCGVGGSSIWLYKKFKTKVYGISISKSQIEKARRYVKKENLGDVINFSVQDYSKTKFPNNKFTLIWAQESLPHEDNKLKFLKESYRLLKKGGRLISSDYFSMKKDYSNRERQIMDTFTNGWAMAHFISQSEFIRMTKKVGFKNVKYYNTTKLIEPSLKKLMHAYLFFKPLAEFKPIVKISYFLHLPIKTNKANINAVKAGYDAYKRKLWGHGVIYAEK